MTLRLLACIAALLPGIVFGWQIEPIVTPTDQKLVRRSGIVEWIQLRFGAASDRVMGDPLHAEIILRAEGCDLDSPGDCFKQRGTLMPGFEPLFGGVQWNDNPPFVLDRSGFTYTSGKKAAERCLNDTIRLPRLPDCWIAAFFDAEKVSERKKVELTYPILYLSHYGDLQFFHGMALDGEPLKRTTLTYDAMGNLLSRGKLSAPDVSQRTPVSVYAFGDIACHTGSV